MKGIDGTTEAGQNQIAALLNNQDIATDYYKFLEKSQADSVREQEKITNEMNAFNNSLLSLADSLRDTASGISGTSGATSQLSLNDAINAARAGDFSKALDLNVSNLNPQEDSFKTRHAFELEQDIIAGKLNALADLSEGAITTEDMMLKANENQVELLTSINNNTSADYVPQQRKAENNDSMVIELKELRNELSEIKYATQATAKHTKSSADDLDTMRRTGIEVIEA
jgi:hypothetical protein